MKYRIKYSDGKHRGGLLKLWTVGADGDRTWRGRSARGYSDEMWRSESGFWRIIKHADEPAISGSKECDDLFDDNSYVLCVSPFEARDWFDSVGISPPEVLLREIDTLPFSSTELWHELVTEKQQIQYTKKGEVVVPEELARRLKATGESSCESQSESDSYQPSLKEDAGTELFPRGLVRDGDSWRIWFDGKQTRIRYLVGIERIAALIQAAPASVPAWQLIQVGRGGTPVPDVSKDVRTDFALCQSLGSEGSGQKDRDPCSRGDVDELRSGLAEVDEGLDAARRDNDLAEICRLGKLRHEILASLKPESARRLASPELQVRESDRKAITNSISSAISSMRVDMPEMAEYLKKNVSCKTPPTFNGNREGWQIKTSRR